MGGRGVPLGTIDQVAQKDFYLGGIGDLDGDGVAAGYGGEDVDALRFHAAGEIAFEVADAFHPNAWGGVKFVAGDGGAAGDVAGADLNIKVGEGFDDALLIGFEFVFGKGGAYIFFRFLQKVDGGKFVFVVGRAGGSRDWGRGGFGGGLGFGSGVAGQGWKGEVGVPSSLILESFFSGLVGFSDLAFPESGREEGRGVMVVSRILGAGRLGVGVADEVGAGGQRLFLWRGGDGVASARSRVFSVPVRVARRVGPYGFGSRGTDRRGHGLLRQRLGRVPRGGIRKGERERQDRTNRRRERHRLGREWGRGIYR